MTGRLLATKTEFLFCADSCELVRKTSDVRGRIRRQIKNWKMHQWSKLYDQLKIHS